MSGENMSVGAPSNGGFQPYHGYVKTASQFGSIIGKKAVEIVAPKLLDQATARGALYALGNAAIGQGFSAVLSPVITPPAAWAAGWLVSEAVNYAGRGVYQLIAKPEGPVEPLEVEHKGLVESVAPGMLANGLVKGLGMVAGETSIGRAINAVAPLAVPVVSEVVNRLANNILNKV